MTALLQDGTLSSLKRYSVLALANLADGNDNNCRDRPCRSYSVSSHSFIRWDKGAEGRGSAVACPPFIRWRSRHGDYQQGRHSTSLNSSTSWIRGPKEAAARALGNLAHGGEANAKEIARKGAIPHLITLLRTGTQDQKRYCALALGNLARTDAIRGEILSKEALKPLVALLRDGTDAQSCAAALAVGNLADSSGANHGESRGKEFCHYS